MTTEKKIVAYPIKQMIIGSPTPAYYYFATKAAQENYYNTHDYCEKLPRRFLSQEQFEEVELVYFFRDFHEIVF